MGVNLDNAIQAHANWRAKLRTAVTQRESLDADTVSRDDCCELGKWLHGAGGSQYGGKPSFVNLLESHRQFHQEAGKVARLINQGGLRRSRKAVGEQHGLLQSVPKSGCRRDPAGQGIEGQDGRCVCSQGSSAAAPSALRQCGQAQTGRKPRWGLGIFLMRCIDHLNAHRWTESQP